MRTNGKITKWNRDKGYGFITPSSGAKQVFVHIDALRNRDLPPQMGQRVTFTLSQDNQGRPCAVDVARDGEPAPRVQRRRSEPRRFGSGTVLIGLIVLAVAVGWYKYQQVPTPNVSARSLSTPAKARPAPSPQFRCDGRTHCSHMSSCEEAKFFIKNCPHTQMDGDGDGVPCERQWCG
jgi:cold shock CspA family protein